MNNAANRLRILSFVAMCVLYLSNTQKTTGDDAFILDPYTVQDRGNSSKKKGFMMIHAHAWILQKRKMYGSSDD